MIREGGIVNIFKKLNTKYLIISGGILTLILAAFLVGHFVRGDSDEEQLVVKETSYDYENISRVFCRLTLYDENMEVAKYEVASAEGSSFVFRNSENIGRSTYSVVSSACKEFSIPQKDSSYIDIEEYKDDYVTGLYNMPKDQVEIYIKQLISDGFSICSKLDANALNEIILEKGGKYRRCIVANDSLMMMDIGTNYLFDADYYIDNYIY